MAAIERGRLHSDMHLGLLQQLDPKGVAEAQGEDDRICLGVEDLKAHIPWRPPHIVADVQSLSDKGAKEWSDGGTGMASRGVERAGRGGHLPTWNAALNSEVLQA